jgi:hypothetical protein
MVAGSLALRRLTLFLVLRVRLAMMLAVFLAAWRSAHLRNRPAMIKVPDSLCLFVARSNQDQHSSSTIYTIGHSTRSLDEFVKLLTSHRIRQLVDVRQYPSSRRYPHFNHEQLTESLPLADIQYVPMKSLGGRRRPSPDSINTGWRNEQFRGYADYMQTPEFAAALDELMNVAKQHPTAIMCAEAVPWRCHRSLISDALLARGWTVLDIFSEDSAKPHTFPDFAEVADGRVTYPAHTESNLFSKHGD